MNDVFDVERFQEVIASCGEALAPNVVVHRTVDSTSSDLKRRLENGAPIGTLVLAKRQTSGRGRSGRVWFSKTLQNLYFSISLSVRGELETIVPLVPLAAGVAAVHAIRKQGGEPCLKWPNDLLLNGRKAAGILCEMVAGREDRAALIVGVGMNLGAQSFPDELEGIATSIPEDESRPMDRTALVADFVVNLRRWVARVTSGRVADLVACWCEKAEPFGRRVRVGDLEGVTEGLNSDGRLIVRKDDGEKVCVVGGIVESLSASDA